MLPQCMGEGQAAVQVQQVLLQLHHHVELLSELLLPAGEGGAALLLELLELPLPAGPLAHDLPLLQLLLTAGECDAPLMRKLLVPAGRGDAGCRLDSWAFET